ncbi:hypothetical protein [Microvirga brassicacearum]|nr:hypothetical protein [Microvirga brassicacearum]
MRRTKKLPTFSLSTPAETRLKSFDLVAGGTLVVGCIVAISLVFFA